MANRGGLSGRMMPWWVVVLLGVICVAVGGVLIGRPFHALTVLVWLISAALLATGMSELSTSAGSARPGLSRASAVVLIFTAIVIVVWPDITVFALAIAAGLAFIVRGVVKVADAVRGNGGDRLATGLTGAAVVMLGAVALSWPAVTVLVLAVVFGAATVVFGFRQIMLGWHLRRGPADDQRGETPRSRLRRGLRIAGGVVAFAFATGACVISVAVHRAQPDTPGPFYTAPSPLPSGSAGTIIRKEIIDGFQPGATTYRVLYISTGFDGAPAAVSGLVIIPDTPVPAGGRKIVGYTHGTVGVATRCAPSNQGKVWADFMREEGLSAFISAGYVVAASDYQGLGTQGPHPYLIGAPEGMNELDIIRVARSMSEAQAGPDVAIWGHSQGGHASLFAGQLASTYAPELHVVGIAAGAPAPDLVEMFKANIDSVVARVLIAMALQAWSQVYDAPSLDQIITPSAIPAVRRIAKNCLFSGAQVLASVPSSIVLGKSFISNPPWETEPWKSIVLTNNPGQVAVGLPVLLTQGADDTLVPPEVTEALLQRMCANGDHVELVQLDGVGHLDGGPAAVPTVAQWIAARFAGAPVGADTCG